MSKANGEEVAKRKRSRSRSKSPSSSKISRTKSSPSSHNHRSPIKRRRSKSRSKSPPGKRLPHRSSASGATGHRSRSPYGGGRTVLESCWKPVRLDPTNFDGWTQLLQCVENLDDMKSAREAFDSFLCKFPYCFGYWRKYAEMERRHKHEDRCLEVYERGLSSVPLSVDLWMSYLSFFKDYVRGTENEERRISQLYDKAIKEAGLEFRSDKLWEDYINWRLKTENYQEVLHIYDRLIKTPLLLYSAHFDKLQEFVNTYEPHEVLSQSEFDKLYKEIEENLKEKGLEIFVADQDASDEKTNEDKKPSEYKKKYSDEALKEFRVRILDKRRKVHLKTEHEVSKRWSYEEAIKRPYFHVKPLERTQLKNWRHYLDFEIDQGDKHRVKILFERCLVACCMYDDIWIRYARYTESVDVEEARQVFKRACQIHLPRKATLHLMWAAFEEKLGHFDYAKAILTNYDLDNPGSVLIQTRRLGLEARRAVNEAKMSKSSSGPDFSEVCKKFETLIMEPGPAKNSSFYAIKYARFQAKIRNDRRFAEKIILDALSRDKSNPQLYMHLVQLAYERESFDLREVLSALDRALASQDLSDLDKLQFSQRKLELLEDLNDNIEEIQRHYESHVKLYKNLGFTTSNKKRTAATDAGKKDFRKPKTEASVAAGAAELHRPAMATMPAAAPHHIGGGLPPHPAYPVAGGFYNFYAQPGSAHMPMAAGLPHHQAPFMVPAAAGPQPPQPYGSATGGQIYGYYVSSGAGHAAAQPPPQVSMVQSQF